MSDLSRMLSEFHAALGDKPGRGGAELRYTLHGEEHRELIEELTELRSTPSGPIKFARPDEDVDRAKLARELADVVYLAFGTAHAFDINLDAALVEVHRAAMSKVDPVCDACDGDGKGPGLRAHCLKCDDTGRGERKVRADGKVLKPDGFRDPDMSKAIKGWRSVSDHEPLICEYAECEEVAVSILALGLGMTPGVLVAPYCQFHAHGLVRSGRGIPAGGPALLLAARKIEGHPS